VQTHELLAPRVERVVREDAHDRRDEIGDEPVLLFAAEREIDSSRARPMSGGSLIAATDAGPASAASTSS
jgi:hypothetical protein